MRLVNTGPLSAVKSLKTRLQFHHNPSLKRCFLTYHSGMIPYFRFSIYHPIQINQILQSCDFWFKLTMTEAVSFPNRRIPYHPNLTTNINPLLCDHQSSPASKPQSTSAVSTTRSTKPTSPTPFSPSAKSSASPSPSPSCPRPPIPTAGSDTSSSKLRGMRKRRLIIWIRASCLAGWSRSRLRSPRRRIMRGWGARLRFGSRWVTALGEQWQWCLGHFWVRCLIMIWMAW